MSEEGGEAELALAQAAMKRQMDMMLDAMKKIEAAVTDNLEMLDERVEALSAQIADLQKKKNAQPE